MMRKILTALLVFFAGFSVTGYGSSTIFLRITKNLQQKAEIVILFGLKEEDYWGDLLKTLSRDLEYSGYFSVTESLFVGSIAESKKKYTTEIILIGEKISDGINIKIEDPLDEKILFEKHYKRQADAKPSSLAHTINNDIVFHFTGKPGIALSKILFVSDATGKYQLYSIDYDGENLVKLTDVDYLVHYPKWLMPHREILYVSYKGGWAKLMKMDLISEKTSLLIGEPGLNACASTCLKTKELAVVLSKTGSPDVYVYGLDGRMKRQLTSDRAIDASPSFSPCGTMLAFVSDRYGSPQIYTMTKDGFRTKRISFISGYSTSSVWSPDGRYIAYVFMRGGSFGIAIYEPPTGETKIIGESLGSEDISWAPDSRHLVYSDIKSKPTSLMIIDIVTGEKRRLISSKFNSFSPNWSNLY
jgi:TolB protein